MMKALQGSEKQVAWAEDIRNYYLEKYDEYRRFLDVTLAGEKSHDYPSRQDLFMDIDDMMRDCRKAVIALKKELIAGGAEKHEATVEARRTVYAQAGIKEAFKQKAEQFFSEDSASKWIDRRAN